MSDKQLEEDRRMLQKLLIEGPSIAGKGLTEEEQKVFNNMLYGRVDRGVELSDNQRRWLRSVYERVFDEPQYANEWSTGKVPQGRLATPIPDVLKAPLPMKPPPRKPDDE